MVVNFTCRWYLLVVGTLLARHLQVPLDSIYLCRYGDTLLLSLVPKPLSLHFLGYKCTLIPYRGIPALNAFAFPIVQLEWLQIDSCNCQITLS